MGDGANMGGPSINFTGGNFVVGFKTGVGILTSVLTLGALVVTLTRSLDPAVTQSKINAVLAEMRTSDAALAAKIQENAQAVSVRFEENERTRAFWISRFQETDNQMRESAKQQQQDTREEIRGLREDVKEIARKVDQLLPLVPRGREVKD